MAMDKHPTSLCGLKEGDKVIVTAYGKAYARMVVSFNAILKFGYLNESIMPIADDYIVYDASRDCWVYTTIDESMCGSHPVIKCG